MTQRNEKGNRAKGRRRQAALTKPQLTRGKRAKRGRRKDFAELFLHLSMIDKRELAAIEGLQSLNVKNAKESVEQAPTVLPSSVESEQPPRSTRLYGGAAGLCDGVKRFVAFAGRSDGGTAVHFRIPQAAHALEIPESTLKFIVDVLSPLEVVKREGCDAWSWTGAERVAEICSRFLQHQAERQLPASDTSENCLAEFVVRLLRVLKATKEPLCSRRLLAEMEVERCPVETANLQQLLRCVCTVLSGIDVIATAQLDSEQVYGPPSVLRAIQHPTAQAERCAEPQTALSCARHAPQGTASQLSVPNGADGTATVLETTPDAAAPRLSTNATLACPSGVPVRPPPIGVTQAAVVEIVGNEVTQVGTIDVLGQGSLTTHFDQYSGTNSVIALAVPEWMLAHTGGSQIAQSVQVYAFEAPHLCNPLALEAHQPMKISCVSVPRGSLLEVLSHTLTAKRSTPVALKSQNCIKQASYAVRF